MGSRPHLQKARFQGARFFWIMLCQDAARIVEVEASHKMCIVRDGKRLADVLQVFRGLIDEHAGAELVQQHHHARAARG